MSDVCKHGSLSRSCEICEAIERAERAEAENDRLNAEAKRLRDASHGSTTESDSVELPGKAWFDELAKEAKG